MSKEFKPKTREQIYKALIQEVATPDDVPHKLELTPYKNGENEPIVNTSITFTAGSGASAGSYVATVTTYDNINENTKVLLNGVSVEKYDSTKTYSAGDLFFGAGEDSHGWNYITVVSFQAEPAAADYVISAYSVVYTVDTAAIQPKTRKEKYLAVAANIAGNPIYTGPIPEPKTIDEYYLALEAGYNP